MGAKEAIVRVIQNGTGEVFVEGKITGGNCPIFYTFVARMVDNFEGITLGCMGGSSTTQAAIFGEDSHKMGVGELHSRHRMEDPRTKVPYRIRQIRASIQIWKHFIKGQIPKFVTRHEKIPPNSVS
jgi:hypothetical protein